MVWSTFDSYLQRCFSTSFTGNGRDTYIKSCNQLALEWLEGGGR
jgi:hypothetical protein